VTVMILEVYPRTVRQTLKPHLNEARDVGAVLIKADGKDIVKKSTVRKGRYADPASWPALHCQRRSRWIPVSLSVSHCHACAARPLM